MRRLLLSGASGFVGHHFLEHALITTGWDIVATGSFRHRGTCDRITEVLAGDPALAGEVPWRDRVRVLTHDLTAPFSPAEQHLIAGADGCDYIVAMASMSHVDTSIGSPVPFIENNVAVILNTLELARVLKPQAVVIISTDEVYGPVEPGQAHAEWAAVLPSNPYSASKAAQEAVSIAYWRTYGVPVILTNTMNMIGERQDVSKFVPKTLRAVLAGEEAVIHGSPGHAGSRHYLHARNLADAVIWLLRNTRPTMYLAHDLDTAKAACRAERKGRPWFDPDRPDRYNVASPDRLDNLELAAMIAHFAGRNLRWRWEDFHATRPGHDAHYGLDPGKILGLGWKPPVAFEESLRRTVAWTMNHREWLTGLRLPAWLLALPVRAVLAARHPVRPHGCLSARAFRSAGAAVEAVAVADHVLTA
jgi:dTDP-glucose 4,6-dehydratase